MSTFERACKEKFERGRKEHSEDWQKIDARFEMKQELTDVYNYASLMPTPLGRTIQTVAKTLWLKLDALIALLHRLVCHFVVKRLIPTSTHRRPHRCVAISS
jgi:hypothetical protein